MKLLKVIAGLIVLPMCIIVISPFYLAGAVFSFIDIGFEQVCEWIDNFL
jgi:hypothetical protein